MYSRHAEHAARATTSRAVGSNDDERGDEKGRRELVAHGQALRAADPGPEGPPPQDFPGHIAIEPATRSERNVAAKLQAVVEPASAALVYTTGDPTNHCSRSTE